MDRRSFLRTLVIAPIAAALAPLVAKAAPATDGAFTAETLWAAKDSIRARYGMSPFVYKEDFSELLRLRLISEHSALETLGLPIYTSPSVPKDTIYLLDGKRMVKDPVRAFWVEDRA